MTGVEGHEKAGQILLECKCANFSEKGENNTHQRFPDARSERQCAADEFVARGQQGVPVELLQDAPGRTGDPGRTRAFARFAIERVRPRNNQPDGWERNFNGKGGTLSRGGRMLGSLGGRLGGGSGPSSPAHLGGEQQNCCLSRSDARVRHAEKIGERPRMGE